jgi:hypothetical protein
VGGEVTAARAARQTINGYGVGVADVFDSAFMEEHGVKCDFDGWHTGRSGIHFSRLHSDFLGGQITGWLIQHI